MILGIERAGGVFEAQVFREGSGGNRTQYLNFYLGDTISLNRVTLDVGVRYDHQNGRAFPSQTLSNKAFPDVVPGITFDGYESPFTWNNVSPRVGATYAVDEARKTVLRASYARYAGQLNTGLVGTLNPTAGAGSATYGWNDLNGDHFAQAEEVDLSNFITSAGGFNPANPTAVGSANVLDPDLEAPITTSVVAGVDRELIANLAVTVGYSYTRTTNLFGNASANLTPRVGVSLDDYVPGAGFSGTIPLDGGVAYNVPSFIPIQSVVDAGGRGFLTTNVPGYFTDYHGLELGLNKRLSNRWMGRVGFAWNNPREHFDDAAGVFNRNGNPTPTATEPLQDGGLLARQSGGSGSGTIYVNAKWQFNANAMYQGPWGPDLSANVFGRQGYPFPVVRSGSAATLGADSNLQTLVSPEIDTFRFPNLWNTDVRVARAFRPQNMNIRVMLDVFNIFNANTALVRVNNVASPNFNRLAQNLSPRIARIGLIVGF